MSKRAPEKRLRLRRRDEVDKGIGRLNEATCKFLEISDRIEIVVAGKKKLELKAVPFPDIPENEVWINTDIMKGQGLSDMSIATVRRLSA
jgi:hypothetical protein